MDTTVPFVIQSGRVSAGGAISLSPHTLTRLILNTKQMR